MKRNSTVDLIEVVMLSVVIAAVIVLSLAARVGAAELPPRTGDRINLFSPPSAMPANSPFWIGHGWCTQETDEEPVQLALDPGSRVELAIDGQPVITGTDVEFGGATELGVICVVEKTNYHNRRVGLPAGTHVVTGCWYLSGELQFCREAEISFE